MATAELIIGPALEVVRCWERDPVQSVITSPPYWRKRDYLEADDPAKGDEWGQEPSPAAFLDNLLDLTDALWDVVADDGTIWFNLGDTIAGSGGLGGDGNKRNRGGGRPWATTNEAAANGADIPDTKAVCWIPQLFGASLAYGRNLLNGRVCRKWITRPPVTWCKPSVTPGRCDDRFRLATELIVWASKKSSYYWDRAAILQPLADSPGNRYQRVVTPSDQARRDQGDMTANVMTAAYDPTASDGVPPLDWWVVNSSGYEDAHFATFPPELIVRPVIASCPAGGTILDPFVGSGTTLAVATGHGRNAIGIDLDRRNEHLIRSRVGMFLLDVQEVSRRVP